MYLLTYLPAKHAGTGYITGIKWKKALS